MLPHSPVTLPGGTRGSVGTRYERDGDDVRKFLFNGSFLAAVFGAWSVVQTTRRGEKDWRLVLMWLSWGISLALAIGSVLHDEEEARALEGK